MIERDGKIIEARGAHAFPWVKCWGIHSGHDVCPTCPSTTSHAASATRDGNTVTYRCYYSSYVNDDWVTHTWTAEILEGDPDWQDLDRTYTPAERQLDVRIDGMPARREAALTGGTK